jgi:hypothetical protein
MLRKKSRVPLGDPTFDFSSLATGEISPLSHFLATEADATDEQRRALEAGALINRGSRRRRRSHITTALYRSVHHDLATTALNHAGAAAATTTMLAETAAACLTSVHTTSAANSLATAVHRDATAIAATNATNTLAAIAAVTGHCLTFATNHGEPDEREEHRNSQD